MNNQDLATAARIWARIRCDEHAARLARNDLPSRLRANGLYSTLQWLATKPGGEILLMPLMAELNLRRTDGDVIPRGTSNEAMFQAARRALAIAEALHVYTRGVES